MPDGRQMRRTSSRAIVKGALDCARADGLRFVAVCPFVRAYLKKHGVQTG